MNNLLLNYFADDFTGATDALEVLSLAGVRTVLFAAPPSAAQLARFPDLRAYGVASTARAMTPAEMHANLRPAFEVMRSSTAPIVHYKVCSTFDSSPAVGNIGKVIEIGREVFGGCVPIVPGAPSLGRYCVFGNLFARFAGDGNVYRIDRHPSMSRHPITPMHEADLRQHLALQTAAKIGLVDASQLAKGEREVHRAYDDAARGTDAVMVDFSDEAQSAQIGSLLCSAAAGGGRFVVGSSGVESALCAFWQRQNLIAAPPSPATVKPNGPIIVVAGSCSPATSAQIRWAAANGFVEIPLDFSRVSLDEIVGKIVESTRAGQSVVVHSMAESRVNETKAAIIGETLGTILHQSLPKTSVRRVVIAGGDTSGQIAAALKIESMEMIAPLTRGAPLVKVTAPGSPADGLEMVFKGGQIGAADFFGVCRG